MKLSPHFSLPEITKSQTALRLGLDNTPDNDALTSLAILCEQVLEPIRKHYSRPVIINSGYRAPAVNKAIGSKSTSQHCKGEAVDFEIPGVDNQEIYLYIGSGGNIDFDQCILEHYYADDFSSGWVHISYRNPDDNRRDRLRIDKSGVRRD